MPGRHGGNLYLMPGRYGGNLYLMPGRHGGNLYLMSGRHGGRGCCRVHAWPQRKPLHDAGDVVRPGYTPAPYCPLRDTPALGWSL